MMLTPSRLVYERMKVTHGLAHARTRTCMTPLNGIDHVIWTAVVKFQVRQVPGQTGSRSDSNKPFDSSHPYF